MKKNVGVPLCSNLFFLCSFLLFFVFLGSYWFAIEWAGQPAIGQALANWTRPRLYGVTHAEGILTEALGKEKPTGEKTTVFPVFPVFPGNSIARPKSLAVTFKFRRLLTLLRPPRDYGPRVH